MPIDKKILEDLKANRVTELNLSNGVLTLDDVSNLAEALAQNTSLRSVNLSHNSIHGAIIEALAKNPLLQSLNLSDTHFYGSEFVQELTILLRTNKAMCDLDLSDNQIQAGRLTIELAQALKDHKSLKQLNVSNNPTIGIAFIQTLLYHNTTLQGLQLMGLNITSDQAGKIARLLEANKSLQELSLEKNLIGVDNDGTQAFPSLLIRTDAPPSKGIIAMAHVLAVNKTLGSLDLSGNKIGGPSTIQPLAEALEVNTSLTHLGFTFNQPIGISLPGEKETIGRIKNLLKRNQATIQQTIQNYIQSCTQCRYMFLLNMMDGAVSAPLFERERLTLASCKFSPLFKTLIRCIMRNNISHLENFLTRNPDAINSTTEPIGILHLAVICYSQLSNVQDKINLIEMMIMLITRGANPSYGGNIVMAPQKLAEYLGCYDDQLRQVLSLTPGAACSSALVPAPIAATSATPFGLFSTTTAAAQKDGLSPPAVSGSPQ